MLNRLARLFAIAAAVAMAVAACATVVLFVDGDGDEELDLGDDRTPVETYGVAEISWTG